ncbi:hypothetical protein [Mycobacterium canetti]|uniref:hypothetical protein n=1 Tax=Mycobacterium canetti TaxID=78331 RepID=UPI001E443D86|nr:hypothetical protein [Mycobacterium canetti]
MGRVLPAGGDAVRGQCALLACASDHLAGDRRLHRGASAARVAGALVAIITALVGGGVAAANTPTSPDTV